MEYPQLTNFLQALPPNRRPSWGQFLDSLTPNQKAQFAELCGELTVKAVTGVNTDGLGHNLSDRVVDIKAVKRLHINVEGEDKPFPAISYRNHIYSLFRTLNDWSAVEKITSRLRASYLVTQTPKGWVVWVHEQD